MHSLGAIPETSVNKFRDLHTGAPIRLVQPLTKPTIIEPPNLVPSSREVPSCLSPAIQTSPQSHDIEIIPFCHLRVFSSSLAKLLRPSMHLPPHPPHRFRHSLSLGTMHYVILAPLYITPKQFWTLARPLPDIL